MRYAQYRRKKKRQKSLRDWIAALQRAAPLRLLRKLCVSARKWIRVNFNTASGDRIAYFSHPPPFLKAFLKLERKSKKKKKF